MASRLGIARIIEWAKSADLEELNYVFGRCADILKDRQTKVENADAHHKVRRTRKAKAANDVTFGDATTNEKAAGA